MRTRQVLVLPLSIVIAASASAASSFKFESTVFYQPDEPLRTRLGSPDELAAHIKRLTDACSEFFGFETTPEGLDIVVGLKP